MEEQHKMAVRIQLRRDTAANWVSANPTLRAGEIGIETDTLKFKIGNGSAWNSIAAYANVTPSSLTSSLGDYILAADQGTAGGPAELDSNGDLIIPENSIILWNDADYDYSTTLTATQPTANRTITLPNATGTMALTSDITSAVDAISTDVIEEGSTNKYFTDERAQDATAAALAAGTHTNITVSYNDNANSISLTGAVTYTDENAQDAIGNALGTGLSYNDSTGAISVDTTTIQARVTDVSDTEIGYLNGVTSGIQSQLNDKAPVNNPTFTGTVTLPGAPGSANEAATKAYVDNITAGLNFHAAVHVATTTDLSATYNNVAGTLSASGTFPTIDGETITETQRVLVKSQSDAKQNGIYELTDDGDPSGTWVLTRTADANNTPAGEVAYGDFVFVQTGSTNGGYGFTMTTTGTITLGTSNINWTQFNAGQTVIAGNGLTETSPGTLAINTSVTADLSTAQTLTNKRLTSPKINEDVAITATATELNYVDGVTSAIQTQLDSKIAKSLIDAKGDLIVGSADDTPAKLTVGTNGYILTANSSATNGVEWAAAPISLPSQTGNSGKYLTTDGSTASWGTVSSYSAPTIGSTSIASGATVTTINGLTLGATSTTSITSNTATTVDTNALSGFTTVKYIVSIKQGSKIRSSQIIAQTDGTNVDYAEFGVVETGGSINGILVEAVASGSDCLLRVTIANAASTNATVKIQEVLI